MKEAGAELLLKTIQGIAEGSLHEQPQSLAGLGQPAELKHAPKLPTDTCRIDWTKNTEHINNLVRGLSPYPTAFTLLENKKLKVFKAERSNERLSNTPGNFETDGKNYLRFACSNGYLNITDMQLEGKKRMDVKDFLRGYRFS